MDTTTGQQQEQQGFDASLFGVPDGFQMPQGMQESFAEVQQEYQEEHSAGDRQAVEDAASAIGIQQPQQEFVPAEQRWMDEGYRRARQELIESRERHLVEMEKRVRRDLEMLDRRYSQPAPPVTESQEEGPLQNMIREQVSAMVSPQMEEMRQRQEAAAYQGAVNSMIQAGANDPNLPDFGRVASLGVEFLGKDMARRLILDRGPVDAARVLYGQGLGLMRMQPQRQIAPQAPSQVVQQPAAQIPANPMHVAMQLPMQQSPMQQSSSMQMPRMQQVPQVNQQVPPNVQPLPRGMQMQGQSAGVNSPAKSYSEIDQWLSGEAIGFNEYDRFSVEHPDLLDNFLRYGTTDPTYSPAGRPFDGAYAKKY